MAAACPNGAPCSRATGTPDYSTPTVLEDEMSLRALPLMVIPLIIYNIVVVFAGGGPATGPLGARCSSCRC